MNTLRYILLFILAAGGAIAGKHPVKSASELYRAIQTAADGDTILIKKGKYAVENITISKRLTLLGEGFPVLDGQFKNEIITVKSNEVHIEGIQFENVPQTSMIDYAGVKVIESEDVIVRNNRFRNCYFGIYLSATSHSVVTGNDIAGTPREEQTTGNGIHAWKCDSILIDNNRVTGHRDGIYFEFVTNSAVKNNYSSRNIRYGLHFMFSHNDWYEYNTFDNNGAGVAVMYTRKVTMKHNRFINNWGASAYGLLLKDISESHMEHNLFRSNTVGIYMDGCSRSLLEKNEFSGNGIALRLQANCDANILRDNNFIRNTFNMATSGNTTYNTISGNYWDNYEGYDLDRNGIGDVPFRPVSLFSVLIERVPQAMMIFRSFTSTLLERVEKIIPGITPDRLMDETPRMKPVKPASFDSNKTNV